MYVCKMINKNVLNTELISVQEFRDFLFDKIVPIDDIVDMKKQPITITLPYWRKFDLIPFVPKGNKFDISFAQLFWIRILDILRSFSYTVKNTQLVCDYFYKDAYESDLPKKNLKNYINHLKQLQKEFVLSQKELEDYTLLQNMVFDEKLMYVLKFDINYLTNLIQSALEAAQPAGIYIFNNGDVCEHIGENFFNHRGLHFDIREPHIYISVDKILEEFIRNETIEKILLPQLLSDDEMMVIREIRNKNVKELIVKKNGDIITHIDSSSTKTITGKQSSDLKVAMGLKNYEEVTLTTRDDKTLIFKKTIKKRLR